MLNEFRVQTIIWDKANSRIYEIIKASEGDSNGRKLRVQILDNGEAINLSGSSLSLAWKSTTNKGLDKFDLVDANKGIFEIFYTTEMLSNYGKIAASLVLIDSVGRLESDPFSISISRSIVDDDSVQSDNSFTALTEALVRVTDLEGNYAPRLNEVTAQLPQKIGYGVKAQLEDLSEEVLASIEGGEGTSFNVLSKPQNDSVGFGSLKDSLTEVMNGYRSILTEPSKNHYVQYFSPNSNDISAGDVVKISFNVQTNNTDVTNLLAFLPRYGSAGNLAGWSLPLKKPTLKPNLMDYEYRYDYTVTAEIAEFFNAKDGMDILAGIETSGDHSEVYIYNLSVTFPNGNTVVFKDEPKGIYRTTSEFSYSEYSPYKSLLTKKDGERIKKELTETLATPKPLAGKSGYTFGDSTVYGSGGTVDGVELPRNSNPWPNQVAEITGAEVVNYGISGATSQYLVAEMTHIKDRLGRTLNYPTPDYSDCDFVTITIGANTEPSGVGSLGEIPFSVGQSVDDLPFTISSGETVTTEEEYWNLFPNNFYGNLALCIEYVKWKNPSTKIFLLPTFVTDRAGYQRHEQSLTRMTEIGSLYNIPIVKASLNIGMNSKNLHRYTSDETHLNDLGNEVVAKYVAAQIVANGV